MTVLPKKNNRCQRGASKLCELQDASRHVDGNAPGASERDHMVKDSGMVGISSQRSVAGYG